MMDEKQARSLVTKLVNAAYEAGMHSTNPNSLFVYAFKKEGGKMFDKIVHHLTTQDKPPKKEEG